MKRIIRSYYKPWLISSIAIVGIAALSGTLQVESPRYDLLIPILVGGTLALTIFCGGIYHFFYEFVKPRRVKKLIKRPKLQYLNELGFEFDNESHVYAGDYKSYYVTIGADTNAQTGDSIIINAFIAPSENQSELLTELQKHYELYFNEGICWLTKRINFLLNTPKQEKLQKQLDQLINDIRFKNIMATEFEEENKENI